MVELIAAIAIVAILVAVMVPAIGNFVSTSRQTADKQTLSVLNDALNRYKMQGGDVSVLTSGASIKNVIVALQSDTVWGGVTHQFLQSGVSYLSASLSARGNGAQYEFSRYNSYDLGDPVASAIISGTGVSDADSFESWFVGAKSTTGSENYLVLTNPNSTDLFQANVRSVSDGDKLEVWWDDGSTDSFTLSTGSSTAVAKTYASAANRTIVLVGDLSRFESNYSDGRTEFGGDISTMPTLTYLYIIGSNKLTGDVSNLPGLKTLVAHGQNTIGGDVTELTGLTRLEAQGSNTLTGDITNLTGISTLFCAGSNTLSGSISGMTGLTYLRLTGNNTVTGDIAAVPLSSSFNCWGSNTISGNIAKNSGSITCGGDNALTYYTTSGNYSWKAGMSRVQIVPSSSGAMTSAMVDALLIDLAATTWGGSLCIQLTGTCGPRTSASDAAVATLQGYGVTVTTN